MLAEALDNLPNKTIAVPSFVEYQFGRLPVPYAWNEPPKRALTKINALALFLWIFFLQGTDQSLIQIIKSRLNVNYTNFL